VNHVAVLTGDLDRFVDFWCDVFELELALDDTTPAFRHALLRISPTTWLHPIQMVGGTPDDAGSPDLGRRGHLDHIGLNVASPEAFATVRRRLIARGACDGTVDDLGAQQSLSFTDPDGMWCEVCLITDPTLADLHAPRPLPGTGPDRGPAS
jgi:catechol 2,3-dioxygenase-like lactoylglutathione lyase family enzyme